MQSSIQGKAPSAGSAASSCNSESAPLLRERRTVSRAEAAGGKQRSMTRRNEMKREFYLPLALPYPTILYVSGARAKRIPKSRHPPARLPPCCEISSFFLSATPPPIVSTNRVKMIIALGFVHLRDRRKASRHRRNLSHTSSKQMRIVNHA